MHAPQFGSAAATTSSGATASTAGFNLPHMVLHMPHLPHLPHLTQMKQQIKDVEVFENGITYLVYLTAPVNVAMLCVGFAHRNDCPADVRLPRYLFFGGLAGVMAALLRIIMEAKWRRSMNVNTQQQGIKFDPKYHPGLGMVRTVMYLFMIFVLGWNINATSHIFSFVPDTKNQQSQLYCHPVAYNMAYVLVIMTDVVAGAFFLIWLSAIIAGLCHPDFLVLHGYYPSISEIGFHKLFSSGKKRKEKDTYENHRQEKMKKNLKTMPLSQQDKNMDQTATVSREAAAQVLQVDVSPLMPQHKEKQERALINLKRLNELKQARESRATTTFSSWSADDDGVQDKIVAVNEEEEAKPTNESSNKSRFNIKVGDDIMEAVSSSNEEEEEDGSDDESKADLETTLSIVRFARDVSLRRISYDVGKAAIASEEAERQQQQQQQQSHKLDITNFPRGPPQPLT